MNRIDRLTAILIQLQSKKLVTADEIAKRFEISKRTVYRDINALSEAGIPIGSEIGKGYFILEGYHLPPVMFTRDEAGAFLIAEKLMNKFSDNSLINSYNSGLFKIKSVLRSVEKEYLESINDSIDVLFFSSSDKDVTDLFPVIMKAISIKKAIQIEYKSLYKNEITNRVIEPVGLIQYSTAWHLIAYCLLRKEYRDFRVNRIFKINITDKNFTEHHKKSLTQFYLTILNQNELFKVVFRIHKDIAQFADQTKYYFGIVNEVEKADFVEMTFMVNSYDYIAKWIIGFGNKIDIIEPEELKFIVKKMVSDLSRKYL